MLFDLHNTSFVTHGTFLRSVPNHIAFVTEEELFFHVNEKRKLFSIITQHLNHVTSITSPLHPPDYILPMWQKIARLSQSSENTLPCGKGIVLFYNHRDIIKTDENIYVVRK